MSLTDSKVKNVKSLEKEYKLTDGFGMHLLVHPNGSKYWRLSYRFDKKQRILALGVYPSVSLSKARERQDEARKLIAEDIDPNAKKKSEATELKAKRNNTRAFKAVAYAWFTTKKKWSEDYQNTIRTRLETYVPLLRRGRCWLLIFHSI